MKITAPGARVGGDVSSGSCVRTKLFHTLWATGSLRHHRPAIWGPPMLFDPRTVHHITRLHVRPRLCPGRRRAKRHFHIAQFTAGMFVRCGCHIVCQPPAGITIKNRAPSSRVEAGTEFASNRPFAFCLTVPALFHYGGGGGGGGASTFLLGMAQTEGGRTHARGRYTF